MGKFFKQLFFILAPRFVPRNRAVILMYHSIGESAGFNTISRKSFQLQMAYLAQTKREVISLTELITRINKEIPLNGAIAITFDDGYKDNLTVATPILSSYGFPATIFVTTLFIDSGNDQRYLSKEDLLQFPSHTAIGAHTVTHPKLPELSDNAAQEEISESKRALEDMRGAPCTLFAYPFGKYSDITPHLVENAGFIGAVTVREKLISPMSNVYELPRVSIDQTTTMAQFKGKLTLAVEWYHALKRLLFK